MVDRFLVVHPGLRFITAKDLPPLKQRTILVRNLISAHLDNHNVPQCQKSPYQSHLPSVGIIGIYYIKR